MLYEDAEVEEVYEDCGGADEDMREEGGIDFAEVAGEESVLVILSALDLWVLVEDDCKRIPLL